MAYTSFAKFEQIIEEKILRLEEVKTENGSLLISIFNLLGRQNFVSEEIKKISRLKVSSKDIFEMELVLSCFVDNRFSLSKALISDTYYHKKDIDEIKKRLENNDQYFNYQPYFRLCFLNKNKKDNSLNFSYVVEDFANSKNLNKDGYFYDINNKPLVETRKDFFIKKYKLDTIETNIINIPEEYFNDNNLKETFLFGYISPEDLKELYFKQKNNLKKLFNLSPFKGTMNIKDNHYIHLDLDNFSSFVTNKNNKQNIKDWSVLDNMNLLNVSFSRDYHNKDILEILGISYLDNILMIAKKEDREAMCEKFLKEFTPHQIHADSLIQDIIDIYNFSKGKACFNLDIASNNHKAYQISTKLNEDDILNIFQLISATIIKIDKTIFHKLSKQTLDEYIMIFKQTENNKHKQNIQNALDRLNKENIKIDIYEPKLDIMTIIYNDTAFFSKNIKVGSLSYRIDEINKECSAVLDEVLINFRKDRLVINLYFNEEDYSLDFKNKILEEIEKILKSENHPKNIGENFNKLKREFNLLKEIEKINSSSLSTQNKKAKI